MIDIVLCNFIIDLRALFMYLRCKRWCRLNDL